MNFPFKLEKYKGAKTRHKCPSCGKKNVFTRYIDANGNYLHESVGKCDRENNCGYHLTPKQYKESGGQLPKVDINKKTKIIEVDYLPNSYLTGFSEDENLFQYLSRKFDKDKVIETWEKYKISYVKRWGKNAIVFPQIDIDGNLRHGKVMLYDNNGHRIKSKINSLHNLHFTEKEYVIKQCFFGEHLLSKKGQKVGIFESEKTALWADIVKKDDWVFLAAGSITGINMGKVKSLLGQREVVLFPDFGKKAIDKWTEYIKMIKVYVPNCVMDKSIYYYKDKKYNGLDLMDLYVK